MFYIPPMQPWDAIHPLIVHIPIGILIVVPVFIVLSLIVPAWAKHYSVSALVLLLLGTAGTFLAISSGDAGAELVERTPEINVILGNHAHLADQTRLIFTIITILYAIFVIVQLLMKKKMKHGVFAVIGIIFLAAVGTGILSLADTGHLGARLVHEQGIKAMINAGPMPAPVKAEGGQSGESGATGE